MVDAAPQQAGSETQAAPSTEAGTESQTRTPEQVEAEWQAKQTALGRQHAAETQSLRTRIAALEAETKASGERTGTENDAIRAENQSLRKQLADRDAAYVVETRKLRYPNAAEALDEGVLAAMDEAKLAGLDARLAPAPAQRNSPVEPSMPPRNAGSVKPINEKTSDELRADLRAMSRQMVAEMGRTE